MSRRRLARKHVMTCTMQRLGIAAKCNRRIKPLMRRDYMSTDNYRKYNSARNLTLHRQVEDSIAKVAHCLLGGRIPNEAGTYYPPTVLTDVRKGMAAFDQERFGPVG